MTNIIRELHELKQQIADITGAELDAYKNVGQEIAQLKQKVNELITKVNKYDKIANTNK